LESLAPAAQGMQYCPIGSPPGRFLLEAVQILKQIALFALAGIAAVATPSAAMAEPTQPVIVAPKATVGMLGLHIEPATGTDAVSIACSGPAGAPVTVTLYATLSSDIPTVVVSRHDFTIDSHGMLATTIPIASDFVRGSILTVRVTSLDTVSPAQASLIVGAPNPHVKVPVEQLPPIFTH
jgi:hypothetical protein